MKKFILSLAVMFSCLAAFGQREIISMDWDVVKDIVREDPDEVRELVSRLSAPTLDTTLTYNDRIIAFYGQSLLSDGREAALVDDMSELQKMYCFDYVWENPADPVAHYVLYRYKWAFSPCEMRTMIDNIRNADSASETYNLTMAEEYVEKQERVQAGQPIIDFTQNDAEDTPVTLSQLAEGKLLLVDFWASWCPDCRKENPNVVAAYQKFHDQGFDVLGVSFDTNKEAWLAAIEKDGLTWTQVSDLQGWNNAAGALYAISFIPQNALIKDGVIVARNLEGAELMEEVERQLK